MSDAFRRNVNSNNNNQSLALNKNRPKTSTKFLFSRIFNDDILSEILLNEKIKKVSHVQLTNGKQFTYLRVCFGDSPEPFPLLVFCDRSLEDCLSLKPLPLTTSVSYKEKKTRRNIISEADGSISTILEQ